MKNWSSLIFLIVCVLTSVRIHAQDIIVKNNNDTIFCKILDVNNENIQYRISKANRRVTNTVSLQYVTSYQILDDVQEPELIAPDNEKKTAFRMYAGGGWARGLGTVLKTNDVTLDQLTNDLLNGYSLEANAEYYFNWKSKDALNFAVALNLNYINHQATGFDVNLPDLGNVKRYEESQTTFYIGPGFVMRYDLADWIFSLSAGYGAVFFSNHINTDRLEMRAITTVFGSTIGIGADYKISSNLGIGVKLSATGGTYDSLKVGGAKVKLEEKMSASSWMISGILSFRTK
jgi:hypothetical protein